MISRKGWKLRSKSCSITSASLINFPGLRSLSKWGVKPASLWDPLMPCDFEDGPGRRDQWEWLYTHSSCPFSLPFDQRERSWEPQKGILSRTLRSKVMEPRLQPCCCFITSRKVWVTPSTDDSWNPFIAYLVFESVAQKIDQPDTFLVMSVFHLARLIF